MLPRHSQAEHQKAIAGPCSGMLQSRVDAGLRLPFRSDASTERHAMRWLRISVLAVLVLGAGFYAWQTFFGDRDRHYYGEQAEKAIDAENWPLAAEHLETLLEVDPENDEGRWILSVVYLRMSEKEGQELADIPETPQSLSLIHI